jgi:Membrane-bound lysozyme-inhibitor of c-type lysozyme
MAPCPLNDQSGHTRSSSLIVSRDTIPPRASGVFMRRRHIVTIVGAAGILIGQSPVFAQTFHTYRCYDGSQFVLAFFEDDKRAHLQLDGKAVTLPKRISLSGSRYAKGDISLRITKTVITLKRGKQSTECITRSWVGSLLPAR